MQSADPPVTAHLTPAGPGAMVRSRGKLWSRGLEKYHLGFQIFKGVRGPFSLLRGDEIIPVDVTGIKELVGGVRVLGIGQKLRPADLPIRGAQRRAQPLKFITDGGSLGSSSGGASAAAQGQDDYKKTNNTEKVHGTPSYSCQTIEKPGEAQDGKTRRERITEGLWPDRIFWFPSSAWEPATGEALLRNLIAERKVCGDWFPMARIGEAGASLYIAFPSRNLGTRR